MAKQQKRRGPKQSHHERAVLAETEDAWADCERAAREAGVASPEEADRVADQSGGPPLEAPILRAARQLHRYQRAERQRRAQGGRAAAAARHTEHVALKVKPFREEYGARLKAGESSPKIIAAMAETYGYSPKRMRDLIKPRARQQENVH